MVYVRVYSSECNCACVFFRESIRALTCGSRKHINATTEIAFAFSLSTKAFPSRSRLSRASLHAARPYTRRRTKEYA